MKKIAYPFLLASFILLLVGCGTKDGLEISSDVVYGKEDYNKITSSQNELGLDWLQHVEKDKNGNAFISPTSLYMALSMVYNGADGVTKEEIAKVLHGNGLNNVEMNKANASLMSMLHNHSEKVTLTVANSIWLNNQYHFQNEFSKNNQDYFNAKIQEIDVKNPDSPTKINDWVKKATNNKINDLVDSRLRPDFITILINAVYFKGEWQYKFNKKDTENRTFHLEDGSNKAVPMMKQNEELDYMENESFQAVSLPYGKGEMSMKVFLPKGNMKIEDFEKMFTMDNRKRWNGEFLPRKGTIMLPKFTFEYDVMLNDTLKLLGMKSAFDSGANFSKMIEEKIPIWISDVKQKTFIDVNEEGSKAAAATSVGFVKSAPSREEPFKMVVNHPFLFTIEDNSTGAILFMGVISNPVGGE